MARLSSVSASGLCGCRRDLHQVVGTNREFGRASSQHSRNLAPPRSDSCERGALPRRHRPTRRSETRYKARRHGELPLRPFGVGRSNCLARSRLTGSSPASSERIGPTPDQRGRLVRRLTQKVVSHTSTPGRTTVMHPYPSIAAATTYSAPCYNQPHLRALRPRGASLAP